MKTLINVKADKDVKDQAQKLAKELGLPLSTVINAYLKDFIRNREISISALPRMTPMLEAIIGQAEKDLKAGRNISPLLSTPDEIDEYLDSL